MNKPQQLLQRLDDIGASLAATDKALASIGCRLADQLRLQEHAGRVQGLIRRR